MWRHHTSYILHHTFSVCVCVCVCEWKSEKISKCQNRDISRPETMCRIFPDIVSESFHSNANTHTDTRTHGHTDTHTHWHTLFISFLGRKQKVGRNNVACLKCSCMIISIWIKLRFLVLIYLTLSVSIIENLWKLRDFHHVEHLMVDKLHMTTTMG